MHQSPLPNFMDWFLWTKEAQDGWGMTDGSKAQVGWDMTVWLQGAGSSSLCAVISASDKIAGVLRRQG